MSEVAANETQSPNKADDANLSDNNEAPSPTPTPTADKDNNNITMATTTDTNAKQTMTAQQLEQSLPAAGDELAQFVPSAQRGRRIVPVHQSRIADRPPKVGEKDSSLKIKIELDLEVEVEIYARVKGDVMIGLM
ncbi:hypothetical protein EPUS_07733 [Endocarpon pusillum Z07020]|uniref:Uncharacterized protein n=1 Tax=Endocarpon pusillum (strain Z07020 / HMAS-L-300199) TaxID=1263415 RepID=U1GMN1_ENDPU|nr:uncharacterized protein EPUS_07733 [Endocarpon pusillum Z07020]ERF73528.1 hypothetical protein EPUS_07733 [Endocarpon pusillum Z07020]